MLSLINLIKVICAGRFLQDEVHERDRFNDFLLVALRDILPKYKNLKLILMSAALNVELFSTYFNNCPVISGRDRLTN